MIKMIILCAIWFAFGVFTGWKIFSHFYSMISIDVSEDFTDEEAEEILTKMMEKIEDEKRKNRNS